VTDSYIRGRNHSSQCWLKIETQSVRTAQRLAMSKALVIGVTVLVLSAASASAQVYLTSDYGYAAPVADLAAPAYGYAAATYVAPGPVYAVPPAYAAPVYAAPPVYAVPAPLYGYYAAPYGYAPGSREWVIERGW